MADERETPLRTFTYDLRPGYPNQQWVLERTGDRLRWVGPFGSYGEALKHVRRLQASIRSSGQQKETECLRH